MNNRLVAKIFFTIGSLFTFGTFQLSIWNCPNALWVHFAFTGLSLIIFNFVMFLVWVVSALG